MSEEFVIEFRTMNLFEKAKGIVNIIHFWYNKHIAVLKKWGFSMLKSTSKQLGLYSILYDKISDDYLLKNIDKVVDFSFINKLLEGCYYSKHCGRPAKTSEFKEKYKNMPAMNGKMAK